jgi:flagellar biosynthesis/type III secretory pathway protein FliH
MNSLSKIITPEDGKLFQSAKKFEKEVFRIASSTSESAAPSGASPKESGRTARGSKHAKPEAPAFDAQRTADRTTRDAERATRRMIREAEKRAAGIRERARNEGRAEGLEEARKQVAEERARSGQLVSSLIEQLKARDAELIASLAPRLADLAVDIAQKIIHSKLAKDSSIAKSLAEDAIAKILDREKLIIRVNPADVELMKAHRETLLGMFDGTEKIEIVATPTVEIGGCIVETSLIRVDAQISSQLEAARRALQNEVES